ncbi:MAG: YcaO-like family protein [Spirochaetales bacterium]|nr:YcaO-like family protein [Spirochaetales bacterium]
MRYYPFNDHIVGDVMRRTCSEHGGILRSMIAAPARDYSDDIRLLSVSGQMPNYHKVLFDGPVNVNYHLTGYGLYQEEATIRLVGEAIERYSLMVGHYPHRSRIRYATYAEISREGAVIPWRYLQSFSDGDYEKFQDSSYKKLRRLREEDVVGWISCPSLVHPGEERWVPLQMLFVGYGIDKTKGEIPFMTGFSTGTASHVSLEKALVNAICEFVQIDALMMSWYAGKASDDVIVDDPTLVRAIPQLADPGNGFELKVMDLRVTEDIDVHVFGCAVVNKRDERPLIVFGAQGELDPLKGVYRGIMEATAISFLGYYGPLYSPAEYFAAPSGASFDDLDKNVSYYIHPQDASRKRALIDGMSSGRKRYLSSYGSYSTGSPAGDLERLLTGLRKISEHAVYLDITPPEVIDQGWRVLRVYIPELCTMCMPGIPYSQHPRFERFGGVKNAYPHPLP